jgi:hypothetical protein
LTALFVPPTQYLLFKFVRPNPIRFFGAAFFPIPEIRTLGLRIQGIGDLLSCVRIRSTFPHSSTATLNRFFCLFFRGKKYLDFISEEIGQKESILGRIEKLTSTAAEHCSCHRGIDETDKHYRK